MAERQQGSDRELVYGVITLGPDYRQLVFAPKVRAEELATIFAALNSATTWGDFKSRVSAATYADAVAIVTGEDEFERAAPTPDEPFDQDAIHGGDPSDWPGWLTQEMLDWMPHDIQQRFGNVEPTTISGDLLALDIARTNEIVEALVQHGYRCTSNPQLVERALGTQTD